MALKATMVSSSAASMYWPWPVRSRWVMAARIATLAYMPVSTSVMAMPTFCGPAPGWPSRSPVIDINPPMPWKMKS